MPSLTEPQLQAIKADIIASPDLAALPNTADGNQAVADLYNAAAAPTFWVWRTDVTRAQLYHEVSPDGTSWNWTTYKNQGVAEQNAWVQMFMGDRADFSKANLRAGVGAIFTGSAQAINQRNHCLSVGRRGATRLEKLLKSAGAGSAAEPATMGYEGAISRTDVENARNS